MSSLTLRCLSSLRPCCIFLRRRETIGILIKSKKSTKCTFPSVFPCKYCWYPEVDQGEGRSWVAGAHVRDVNVVLQHSAARTRNFIQFIFTKLALSYDRQKGRNFAEIRRDGQRSRNKARGAPRGGQIAVFTFVLIEVYFCLQNKAARDP